MGLYDAVTNVGVRSHYKATLLGLPLLRKSRTRGLIVNSNSAACLMYALNVPYGMGKCAIDMARVNSGVITTSSTTTTRTTKQKDCTDAFKEDCALWANKNYCVTSAAFMAINCKQSCGTC